MPPVSTATDHQANSVHVKPAFRLSITTISFIAIFLFILFLGGFAVYGIASAFPTQMKNLVIAIDRFGITRIGAYEQQRIRAINRLSITHEEKQVLIKRTVFFGATRDMVELALGKPACVANMEATSSNPVSEKWVYFIEADSKPTQLLFQSNGLVSAGKTSALDSCK